MRNCSHAENGHKSLLLKLVLWTFESWSVLDFSNDYAVLLKPFFFVCLFVLQGNSREVVAVKVVGKKTLNKASTENLLTEIEILKTVRHPHIVQLKDFQVSSYMCFSIAGTYARFFFDGQSFVSHIICLAF